MKMKKKKSTYLLVIVSCTIAFTTILQFYYYCTITSSSSSSSSTTTTTQQEWKQQQQQQQQVQQQQVQQQQQQSNINNNNYNNNNNNNSLNSIMNITTVTKENDDDETKKKKELLIEYIINEMKTKRNPTIGQFALDFAILGYPKCGTSAMMYWLHQQKSLFSILPYEVFTLQKQEPWDLVKELLTDVPFTTIHEDYLEQQQQQQQTTISSNTTTTTNYTTSITTTSSTSTTSTTTRKDKKRKIVLRGYKSPNDIEMIRVLRLYKEFFPKTKLIIGIRHPILWYESFYNFRIQNGLLDINSLHNINNTHCTKGNYGVCIERSKYHISLVQLGKTNFTKQEQSTSFTKQQLNKIKKTITGNTNNYNNNNNNNNNDFDDSFTLPYIPNKVFLYDITQLKDDDEEDITTNTNNMTLNQNFRYTLQQFLFGNNTNTNQTLQKNIIESKKQLLLTSKIIKFKPGHTNLTTNEQMKRNKLKINICDTKYNELRIKLLRSGKKSSYWILNYFINSNNNNNNNNNSNNDIIIPNRKQFISILNSYKLDPCVSKKKNVLINK